MNRVEFLAFSIAVFLTIVAWMIVDIYHIQQKEFIDRKVRNFVVPKYTLDLKILDKLKMREP